MVPTFVMLLFAAFKTPLNTGAGSLETDEIPAEIDANIEPV